MTIGVIACGNNKRSTACRARDLYIGTIFRANRAWIVRNCERWVILSAKYGVLEPDQVVEPYDATLKQLTPADLAVWQAATGRQLSAMFPGAFFLILGGTQYRGALNGLPHCYGQAIPATVVDAQYKLISPAFRGLGTDPATPQGTEGTLQNSRSGHRPVECHTIGPAART